MSIAYNNILTYTFYVWVIKKPLNFDKARLKTKFISNININRKLYNKDGTEYEGLVHRVLEGPNALAFYSGGSPSKDSKLLYGKKLNNGLVFKKGAKNKSQELYHLSIERSREKSNGIY